MCTVFMYIIITISLKSLAIGIKSKKGVWGNDRLSVRVSPGSHPSALFSLPKLKQYKATGPRLRTTAPFSLLTSFT